MNNEVLKPTEQNPQGYGPKKPEILTYAQKSDIFNQKDENSGRESESFEYLKPGRMRFIGANVSGNCRVSDSPKSLDELMPVLKNLLKDHASVIPFFTRLCHHSHKEIGEDEERYLDGYFFREGTPVPDGADYFDILSEDIGFGVYLTRDVDEDWGKRYDQTRDRILGDGNLVPYPIGYWDSVVKIDEPSKEGEFAFGIILPAVIGMTYDTFLEEVGMI